MKSPRQLLCLLGLCLLFTSSTTSASGRVTRIKADFGVLRTALVAFEIDAGRAPAEAEGLDALVNRPSTLPIEKWRQALDESLLDPWGNEYGYRTDLTTTKQGIGLYSLGPDGISHSRGNDDDDINNWNPNSPRVHEKHQWSFDDFLYFAETPLRLFLVIGIVFSIVFLIWKPLSLGTKRGE